MVRCSAIDAGNGVPAAGPFGGFGDARIRAADGIEREPFDGGIRIPSRRDKVQRERRSPTRRGLSLLEVLIAMGVLVIGLLGVAAMLPVGQHYVGSAERLDSTAAVGQTAMAEIAARDLVRPRNDFWLQPNGATYGADLTRVPLAIDPLASAVNGIKGNPSDQRITLWFPPETAQGIPTTGPNAAPRLRRATIPPAGQSTGDSPNPPWTITLAVAERIFTSHDDLALELPDDRDVPSIALTKNVGGNPVRRQFRGNFSWMFTVFPVRDSGATSTDMFTVSVVVFERRRLELNPGLAANDARYDPEPPERMVLSDSIIVDGTPFDNRVLAGVGGVDTHLVVPEDQRGYLANVRPHEWVLLSGIDPSGLKPAMFHWYRIIMVDGETLPHPQNSSYVYRHVMLAGPDWDPDLATYVSLFEGAVGVYEKTVRGTAL